jgi:hypothetical protein
MSCPELLQQSRSGVDDLNAVEGEEVQAAWQWPQVQPSSQAFSAAANASSMTRRMVLAQRPHCALQPRQRKTSPAVCGACVPLLKAARTARSDKTLQEQMIMADDDGATVVKSVTY